MKRRCEFLDTLPAFNYNSGRGEVLKINQLGIPSYSNTEQLGSTLMNAMLKEVGIFCDPKITEEWTREEYQQVSYNSAIW